MRLKFFVLVALAIGTQHASTSMLAPQKPSAQPAVARISLSSPKSGERIVCSQGADGLFRFSVRGASQGLTENGLQLLLWVNPVRPSAGGWFLQRQPLNGIQNVAANGAWDGVGQIGNLQYPPHSGDLVEIAVTAVNAKDAKNMLNEPGVVVRGQPVGSMSDKATNVVVTLETGR